MGSMLVGLRGEKLGHHRKKRESASDAGSSFAYKVLGKHGLGMKEPYEKGDSLRHAYNAEAIGLMHDRLLKEHPNDAKKLLDMASEQLLRHMGGKTFEYSGHLQNALESVVRSYKAHGKEHTEKVLEAINKHGIDKNAFTVVHDIAGDLKRKIVFRYSKKNVATAYRNAIKGKDYL